MKTKKKTYKKPLLEIMKFNKFFMGCCAGTNTTVASTKPQLNKGVCKCGKKGMPFDLKGF
jgi:hypothetical protein